MCLPGSFTNKTLLSLNLASPGAEPTPAADYGSPPHFPSVPHLPQTPPASGGQACICKADTGISPQVLLSRFVSHTPVSDKLSHRINKWALDQQIDGILSIPTRIFNAAGHPSARVGWGNRLTQHAAEVALVWQSSSHSLVLSKRKQNYSELQEVQCKGKKPMDWQQKTHCQSVANQDTEMFSTITLITLFRSNIYFGRCTQSNELTKKKEKQERVGVQKHL